jgi:hypothetical protein
MGSLLDRYASKIVGVLGCFDRVVIQGTLPVLCFAEGMASLLRARGMKLFDYPKFAEPFRDQIRANAETLATQAGIEIEFMRKTTFRKDDRIAEIIKERGNKPGLVAILSAMEACHTYRPWHDKKTGKTSLRPDMGKCLHYYFYFLDPELGLCYMRVPTWCPFRLQFYFNGHNQLAAKLDAAGISYKMMDNAFAQIANIEQAQQLSDDLDTAKLHAALDRYATLCCPAATTLETSYHWSLMQVEYSTDIVFFRQSDLKPLYDTISRTAIHAVKAENVATFLGRKLHGNFEGELGNNFSTRIEGTRIKHHMGPTSIKMYDKAGIILRIETTTNDVSFFKHHRVVEQRDGAKVIKLAPLKKSIYSLGDLRKLLAAANKRYLEYLSVLEDPSSGGKALQKITEPVTRKGRRYRGLNFFSKDDCSLLQAMARGEFAITGMRNKDLQRHIPGKTSGWISRSLKRLRVHGLIKRVGRTYKHYLTDLGRQAILGGLKFIEMTLIPTLAASHQSL